MSQHDYVLDNASGLLFRADLNNVLQAIATNNSGNTAPTETYPFQFWVDTSGANPILKQRNAADSAWITVGRTDLEGFGLSGAPASASAPADVYPYRLWIDTSGANPILKIRNAANNAWISLGRVDVANFALMPLTGGVFSGPITFSNTDSMSLPVGTDAQRPGSPTAGMIRYNSDQTAFEGHNGSAWAPIGGGGFVVSTTQSLGSGGTITTSTTDQRQLRPVQGSGGAQVISTTPFGASGGWKNGTEIVLIGIDDANSVILTFNDAAKGLVGNFSTIELTKFKTIECIYSSALDRWIVLGGL